MMSVSENIAQLNAERYANFQKRFEPDTAKQALLAFKGDVYTKIDVDNYTEEDFDFAQRHLRILSGLYGVLRPLDLIQPYRLEMGIRIENGHGKNLYEFWGARIAKKLNEDVAEGAIINLASQEYFKAVSQADLQAEVISPAFKEFKNGSYKVIGIYAKQARGLMADYIIKNRITDPEELKAFTSEGYEWAGPDVDEGWTFRRG
ncbi:hypothetical protein A3SI_15563 [Nitritalea halalkaliphila LW7]|uniref:UPF0246 protein A3SI_15563 n=2 Tax=Nitritalea TaxID=1187887 RepID=I5BY97_9BACT|nr:hypothetical protein A3SI_15563 [Nitritalea halalkaliphila LW7]